MKTLSSLTVPVLVLAGMFAGCTDDGNPVSDLPSRQEAADAPAQSSVSAAPERSDPGSSIPAGPYTVTFDGRVYDGTNTAFNYTVTGAVLEPESHFTIQIPSCAPDLLAYAPTEGVTIEYDAATGVFRIDWPLDAQILAGASFSITFPGDVPLGVVEMAIRTEPSGLNVVEWFGPCAGELFDISGTVFADADADGMMDAGAESGLADVTVSLEDAQGGVVTAKTDAGGAYLFADLFAGSYTLSVAPATDADDFNEELFDSFDATTDLSIPVTIGPDATGNDFGFSPRIDDIIADIEAGVIVSDLETVRFWGLQVKAGMTGGNGRNDPDPAVQGYLDAVEELLQPDPFQFDDADEFRAALEILQDRSSDPVDSLKTQLLAAELNHVSGRGITSDPGLLLALIAWGEAVVIENQTASKAVLQRSGDGVAATSGSGTVNQAIALFAALNSSGGGGGGNE